MTHAPFFIVGANRSGTTLLRLLLNAHSRLAVPEEMVYVNARIAGVALEAWARPGWTPDARAAFVDAFVRDTCRHLGLDAEALRAKILDGPDDLRAPYACALEAWARAQGKARWGEKTPGNLFYADVLHAWFPEARFVHLVRDPRAGVASLVRAPFCTDDLTINALNWHKHLGPGRARFERSVPARQRQTIRYEDLVEAPEATLEGLCAFLGEAFEPAMLGFHASAARYMKPEAAGGFNAAATRPVSSASLGKWRHQLSPREVSIVEAVCHREMDAFGYAREGAALSVPDRLALGATAAYWAAQNWRNRARPHYTLQHRPFARPRGRAREGWLRLTGRTAPAS